MPIDIATVINGVVAYESRYGATEQYAQWMRQELRIPLIEPERLDDQVLHASDFLVVATPVYRGKMLVADWLRDNQIRLRETRLFLVIVCTHFSDKEKQMNIIRDNIPSGMLAFSQAWFLPGRVISSELNTADAQYLNLAMLSAQERAARDAATRAGDPVRKENILPVIPAVHSFASSLRKTS